MSGYRYILDNRRNRKKYKCPACGEKTAVVYIDTATNEALPDHVCKCDRLVNCTYHYTPKQYFDENPGSRPAVELFTTDRKPEPEKPLLYFDKDVFAASLADYENNSFVHYLNTLFDSATVEKLITNYGFGTSHSRWGNACVFWFITIDARIKCGQIKLFDATGHTASYYSNKAGKNKKCTDWAHNAIKYKLQANNRPLPGWLNEYIDRGDFCTSLYGGHLINLPENINKPIALVEAPKTAIVASVYIPQYLWLATGSLGNFTEDRIKVLAGRTVHLYPDLGAFDNWDKRGKCYSHIADFVTIDILEKIATVEERENGFDLCDYLTRVNHAEYLLMDQYRQEYLQRVDMSDSEQLQLWEKYREMGLTIDGRNQILQQLIESYNYTVG